MYPDEYDSKKRNYLYLAGIVIFVIIASIVFFSIGRTANKNQNANNSTQTTQNNAQQNNQTNSNNQTNNNTNIKSINLTNVASYVTLLAADNNYLYYRQDDEVYKYNLSKKGSPERIAHAVSNTKANLENNQLFIYSSQNNLAFIYDTYNMKLNKLDANVIDVFWWKDNIYYLIQRGNKQVLYDYVHKRDIVTATELTIYTLSDNLIYTESSSSTTFKAINPVSRVSGAQLSIPQGQIYQVNAGIVVKAGSDYKLYKNSTDSGSETKLNKDPKQCLLNNTYYSDICYFLTYNSSEKSISLMSQEIGQEASNKDSFTSSVLSSEDDISSSKVINSNKGLIIEYNNSIYVEE